MSIFDFFPSLDFSRIVLFSSDNGSILISEESLVKIEKQSQPLALELRNSSDHFDYLVSWYCQHLKSGGEAHMDMEQCMFERRFAERKTA